MSLGLSSRKEIAEYFGVTYNTIQNWEKSGVIKQESTVNGRPRYLLSAVIESVTNQKKGGTKCN